MVSLFDQGDIVYVQFDPSVGHEAQKRRPAIVVSTRAFNLRSCMTVVCPITSADNHYPLHVPLPGGLAINGFVCVEQLKALDLEARRAELVDRADAETMADILDIAGAIFGI